MIMNAIRPMRLADLQQVNLTLSKAFTHARLQDGMDARHSRIPLLRHEFLKMYFTANPGGSFVAVENDRVVGFCFSRRWGRIGWLGPLSVLPEHENRHLGTALLEHVIAEFQKKEAVTIGLEMVAGSVRNLAFYAKAGFRTENPAVDMVMPANELPALALPADCEVVQYSALPEPRRQEFLEMSLKLCDSLQPGLDYTAEILLTREFSFGDTFLVLKRHKPWGFFLGHTETYSSQEKRQFLKINALQLAPGEPLQSLDVVLAVIKNWALKEKLTHIYVRVPLRYYQVFTCLLEKGFKVFHTDLRLTLKNYGLQDDPGQVNLNKWE